MLKQIDFDEMAVRIKLNVTKLMIKLYIYWRLVTFVQNFKSSFCEMVNLQFNMRYECMLNRLLLISLEVCLNLVLVNIRLLDYYQNRDPDWNIYHVFAKLFRKT